MTPTQGAPIRRAIALLREAAEEYKLGISIGGIPDWDGEPETKAAYDEHMAVIAGLESIVSGAPRLPANYTNIDLQDNSGENE